MCVARSTSYASLWPIGSVPKRRVLYGRIEHKLDSGSRPRSGEGTLPLGERYDLAHERLELDLPRLDELERAQPRLRSGGIAARDGELAVADLVERDRHRLAGEPDLDETAAPCGAFHRELDARGAPAAFDHDVEAGRCTVSGPRPR